VRKLLVIGGGIAGLAAAWQASRSAEKVDITLVERDQRLGGKIRTDSAWGFLLEQGPDSFLTSRPEALRLCRQLGISSRLVARTPRGVPTSIMHGHALTPLPEGFAGMLPMDTAALAMSPLISEAGRRRLAEGPSAPAWTGGDDESIATFVVRQFGEEVFQYIVEPLVGGIHAGDAKLLSRQAVLDPVQRGRAVRGARSDSRHQKSAALRASAGYKPAPLFLTFPGGTAELVAELEKRLVGIGILRGTTVEAMAPGGRGWQVETSVGRLEADAVIVSAPAFQAARMFGESDPGLQQLLGTVPFASTVIIHLGYAREDVPHPLDGYGYLIPAVEGSDLVACTWSSQKWEGRAPGDFVLMRLFAGRFGRPDLMGRAPGELFAMARAEVAATLGISAAPVLELMHRWDMGMPQYTVGHLGRVAAIRERAARHPGLVLAGASFDGVGIPQCIASGLHAAADACAYLSRQEVPA
jgi:protoporphyrinogen/coproporphyrinogen III oxidase